MKYRHTGAWWFMNALWRYYMPHYAPPDSDGQHFFIDIAVIPQERLLPFLRRQWARHLRTLRRERAYTAADRCWRYRMSTGSGDPVWRDYLWPELCAKRRFIHKAHPRMTGETFTQDLAEFVSMWLPA